MPMTFKSYQKIFNWAGQSKNGCFHFQIECIQLEILVLCLFLIFIFWINYYARRKGRIFMNNHDLEGCFCMKYRKVLQTIILHLI